MRIAFYAPLKSPTHEIASGDRRVARLLMDALRMAGHTVELASDLRSFDGTGSEERQRSLQARGAAVVQSLLTRWQGEERGQRPELWFTYHVYYKAPDWLGPVVSRALDIPYVVAEASFAPKRAGGPWALGHAAALDAIRRADMLVCPTEHDVAGLRQVAAAAAVIQRLPPFLDPQPYQRAARKRSLHRSRLCRAHGLDGNQPWLVVSAMMRFGDKLASYQVLARALQEVRDLAWQVLVAGDGAARGEVELLLAQAAPGRVRFLGACDARAMAAVFAAGDLCIWPAVNEAYGMALLEAQAAGTPVVSCAVRGVPDVVCDGRTGLLAAEIDARLLAQCVRSLLCDAQRRQTMGQAAARFVERERSVARAAATLDRALAGLVDRRPARRGAAGGMP